MSTAPVHVPPSPMSLGDVFVATFSVFRRRIGAFLALTGLQQLVSLVALAIPVVLALGVLVPSMAMSQGLTASSAVVALLVLVGGVFVAVLLTGIASLYFDGMMIACAHEAALGRFPTLTELRHLSKGYVGRIIGLYLLAMLAYLMAVTIVFLPLVFSLGSLIAIARISSRSAQTDAGLAFVGALALTCILALAMIVGAFLVGVKVAYVAQVCVVERLSGFAALRRAWGITKGAFWRTFGYLAVFSLAAGAVQQGISFVTNFFVPTVSSATSSSSGSAVLEMLHSGSVIMMVAAISAIAIAIQLVMVPLRHTYVTVMYADQLRRRQLGPVNHAFVLTVPGYGPKGYGHQPYPYPPGQGFPQGGPHPGYGQPPAGPLYGQQSPYAPQAPNGQG